MRRRTLALALLVAVTAPAAADFDSGYAALQENDYATAFRELQEPAQSGDERAQYILGVLYKNGFGAPLDSEKALDWLVKAAGQGYVEAQMELARMYQTGDGVAENAAETAKWYLRAAEHGHVGAQLNVADMYAYGEGVPQDFVKAFMWYEIAVRYWGALAVGARDAVTELMTPEQIAEGRRLAQEWTPRAR